MVGGAAVDERARLVDLGRWREGVAAREPVIAREEEVGSVAAVDGDELGERCRFDVPVHHPSVPDVVQRCTGDVLDRHGHLVEVLGVGRRMEVVRDAPIVSSIVTSDRAVLGVVVKLTGSRFTTPSMETLA